MTVSVSELGFSNFLKVDLRVKILITEVFLGVLWESQGLRVFDYATFEGHGVLFYFGDTF